MPAGERPLPAAVRGGGPIDVRIATPEGTQVPYLLETLAEPLALTLLAPRPTARPDGGGRGGPVCCAWTQ